MAPLATTTTPISPSRIRDPTGDTCPDFAGAWVDAAKKPGEADEDVIKCLEAVWNTEHQQHLEAWKKQGAESLVNKTSVHSRV